MSGTLSYFHLYVIKVQSRRNFRRNCVLSQSSLSMRYSISDGLLLDLMTVVACDRVPLLWSEKAAPRCKEQTASHKEEGDTL